ncbi:30S ribosomal protein S8 [bacterium BMS3Abin01]|nr:30S ribosomal protein S8 [bacterium BMS3Abin01]HDZ59783.1 30S ribosomal protein S8 [Actinomycetota bacterium]
MTVTDPIADMLTRIRNANTGLKESVEMPVSRMKMEIARLLKEEGYILDYAIMRGESYDNMVVDLKYGENKKKVISGLKRISKPGRRVYARKDSVPRVLGGLGVSILSTSRGLMTGRQAERDGIGGEVICFIW